MERFEKIYSLIEDIISGVLVFVGLGIIFYGVFMRYVLDLPQPWIDDVSRYVIIWGILIGASVALRFDEHIKVDILYEIVNQKWKKIIDILSNLVGLGFFIFLSVYSFELILRSYESQQIVIGIQIPIWLIYLIFPIMGLLMSIRYVLNLVSIGKINVLREGHKNHDHNSVV